MSTERIAQAAGVSKATVSRVLNGSTKVAAETRQKVLEVVDQLGLTPSTRKKSRPGKNITVLIFGRDLFMEYSPARWRILYGIQKVMRLRNVNLSTYQIIDENDFPAQSLENADGVIVLGKINNENNNLLNNISQIPSVWINSMGSTNVDMALARNQLVGQIAAQYLIARKHKCLAFFRVIMSHAAIETDGDFFEFTATKSGCTVKTFEGMDHFPDQDELENWLSLENIVKQAMKKLSQANPRPTGLFVPLGAAVPMCYKYLHNEGIKPGRDIDIVSCGCENAMMASLSPHPANISLNVETIGEKAASQLINKIEHPRDTSPVNITVIPTLTPASKTR